MADPIEVSVVDEQIEVAVSYSTGITVSDVDARGPWFVYNSSGTAGGNVFTSWSSLVSALDAAPDGDNHIQFQQNETLPAGAWNLHGATMHGLGAFGASAVFVTFPTGCTITNPGRVLCEGGINLVSTSNAPVYTITGVDQVYAENDASIMCTTAEFFRVTATSGLVLFSIRYGGGWFDATQFGYGTTYEVLNITAAGANVVVAVPAGNGRLDNNTIRSSGGAATAVLAVASAAMGVTNPFVPRTGFTHANAAGGVFEMLLNFGANVFYDNATSGMSAANVQAALDELDARVTVLEP